MDRAADRERAKAMIEFTVRGVPIPKGSTKAFFRPGMKFPIVTAANVKSKPWQEQIRMMAQAHAPAALWTGAVSITASFFLPRPKSLPRRVVEHVKKPDSDKLLRNLLDALKGVVYQDDAQVTEIHATKRYSDAPGVVVRVEEIP